MYCLRPYRVLFLLPLRMENHTDMNYYFDKEFFASRGISTVELKSRDGQSRVLVVPDFQGRVMTSTTGGYEGKSFGWINYKAIASEEVNPQFNPYGGEERFWIGPEGGPFSYYFKEGDEQTYANWDVPKFIDTEPFHLDANDSAQASFHRKVSVRNASGFQFEMKLGRTVTLLDAEETCGLFGLDKLGDSVKILCYRTSNSISNEGNFAWTAETGMPSVWILGCFNPTPTTTVFIPFNKSAKKSVNDEYFGKVPSDRLTVGDGVIFFRIDGEYRAKIGLPADSAMGLCGSYDSKGHVLTILKYNQPEGDCDYVNGQWGHQDDPFHGDVINSYNDGPTETGTVMGPFYEVETSSPAAALAPGGTLVHEQYTCHIEGDELDLAQIVRTVFGLDLDAVKNAFNK